MKRLSQRLQVHSLPHRNLNHTAPTSPNVCESASGITIKLASLSPSGARLTLVPLLASSPESPEREKEKPKMMSTPYELRTGGDGKSKKQSMAELKLRRLTELNARLKEDLERRRIPVSEAAME
ncbi:hypothetical protein H2199_004063 [Coniosporium tulheliwenetii]|uniref:Uncharacterized protein n=1 Tax=Coniosporium tulheliwenetii TaxID=3383036 RepID=A0ACC2Z7D3_9PEZI|nr:hypothetical protein H2199_004063 [Cladosporium sp. JES 115]